MVLLSSRPDRWLEQSPVADPSTSTIILTVSGHVDAAGQAGRFAVVHAEQSGLDAECVQRLTEVTGQLARLGSSELQADSVALHVGKGDDVRVCLTYIGPGNLRITAQTCALLNAEADQWGCDRTPVGVRIWAAVRCGAQRSTLRPFAA